ncbi:hypothetical protein MMC18_007873 [Xylographa bjoerkii]|nr:hypothetical protein [Xylographa bjoerkii]
MDGEIIPAEQLQRLAQFAVNDSQSLSIFEEQPNATTTIDREARRTTAIAKVEDIFCSLVHDLKDEQRLSIPLKTRQQKPAEANAGSSRMLCFPGRTDEEARRFAVVIRILSIIHEALVENTVITKRAIFYQDPELFSKQSVVDRLIDDIAFMFEVQRCDLNVIAAAKGLVAGLFSIIHLDGSTINVNTMMEGILVPNLRDSDRLDISSITWVLVIEKEATFYSLVSARFYRDSSIGDGVLITGKGSPDIATRKFLRRLSASQSANSTPPPIFALVDFDPYGLEIVSTYKHGSKGLAHENAELVVPTLRWLGLKSKDIPLDETSADESGLMILTSRDRKMVVQMLARPTFSDEVEPEWRKELQSMLMLDMKAEIQLLDRREGGLATWLKVAIIEGLGK